MLESCMKMHLKQAKVGDSALHLVASQLAQHPGLMWLLSASSFLGVRVDLWVLQSQVGIHLRHNVNKIYK